MSDDLYLLHRASIEQAIRAVSRRQRLSADDAEDFASAARLHLIDRNFEVLRRFQGRSSMGTYLLTVVTHFGQDWRNAQWGKWRPSAAARRQGPLAVHLERLMVRDGLSFEEAFETLRTNFRVTESRKNLETIASRLPARAGRRFVSDEELEDAATREPAPDRLIDTRETADELRLVLGRLASALRMLPPQDQLILKLRFEDGLKIVEVGRLLRLEDKPLYRRIERVLDQLRAHLEQAGLSRAAARQLLADQGFLETSDPPTENGPDVRLFPRGERPNVQEGSTR